MQVGQPLCGERKWNRRQADFKCRLAKGHPGPHVDAATGKIWGLPGHKRGLHAYGLRNRPPENGSRIDTKPRSWFSDAPADD